MHMMADTSTLKPIQRVKPMDSSEAKSATVGWPLTSDTYVLAAAL